MINGLCALVGCAVGLLPLAAWGATPIYRSVGVGSSALVNGAGTLTLTGTVASFAQALPANIGVGDVIEYDSDNDGARDAIAFIYGRAAGTPGAGFSVRNARGATAVPTAAATTRWAVFRAYASLNDATRGLENAAIGAAWRDFDPAINGKNIVAADETWNIACYADDVDDAAAALCSSANPVGLEGCAAGGNHGWTTDATHTVHIYTPVAPFEVGVSQRHTGRWGTGYRRTHGLYLYPEFIWVDGLSARVDDTRCYLMLSTGNGGRVWLSNSFGWTGCTSCTNMRVFDVWAAGVVGPLKSEIRLWNDIGVADTSGDPSAGAFYLNSSQARYWLYNCTAAARGAGYGFYLRYDDLQTAKNCLGVSALPGQAFNTSRRWAAVISSAANDSSVFDVSRGALVDDSASVFANQSFRFVSEASADYHLALDDVGARRRGVDLSADPELAFTDDIDGEFRGPGSARWDIGADQTVASDGGVPDGGVPDAGLGDAGVGNELSPGRYRVGCACDSAGGGSCFFLLVLALGSRARRGQGTFFPATIAAAP